MQTGRIKYERPSNYCNKVFIGNWYESRCKYKKSYVPFDTTYSIEFGLKPHSAVDPNVMWKTKIEHEGFGPRLMTDHGSRDFLNNLSTLYDLSYNHFPKCIGTPIYRKLRFKFPKYMPEDDYLPSYGNITKNGGIVEAKIEQWKCDKGMVRRTGTTNSQDAYVPPEREYYMFKRFSVPLCNSSKMDKTDQQALQLRLRDLKYSTMRSNETLKAVCREPRCNPITWECPPNAKKPIM